MAEQAEEIIIDVKINADDTAKELSEVTALLSKLKAEQKALTKEIEAGNDADGEKAKQLTAVAKEVQALTAQQKALTGQLQTTYKANNELGDSFREMDARARQLENQYKALSKAQRESAEGQALKQMLIEQKQALEEFDAELGNHQRNVGNYPKVLAGVLPGFNNVSSAMGKMGVSLDSLAENGTKAFAGLGKSVKAFGKMFLTPPIVIISAVLGGIMFAAQKLKEAFERNDDASTKLQAAFAKLEPIGDAIGIMFNKLADVIAGLVEKIMSAYTWIIKLGNRLGIVSDDFVQATEAASNLVKSIDELEQMERNYTVNSARRSKEIARLRNEAMSTDDLQARIAMLKEAIALEEDTLRDAQEIARKRLANLEQEAQKIGDTSDETANKIAQARAAMYQAEEAYYTGTRRLLKELQTTEGEYIKELSDREELDNFIQATLEKFMTAKKAVDKLTKPEPMTEEEEEEFLRPLNDYQQKIADLMAQGYSFADAQRKVAAEAQAAWAGAASAILGGMGNAFGQLSELFGEYSEQSEEAAAAAKGFAIVGVLADQAQAIAAGVRGVAEAVASGAGQQPFPANIVAMASGVAAVTSTIASVIGGITQAKNILSGAKFATGGIVGGTSYTGDRVPAMVNSGEMILNKEQQSRLFVIANTQGGAGGYEAMRAAMSDALRAMPAPVMVYREFEQFQRQTTIYKELVRV